MASIYVGIGSNIDSEYYIQSAIQDLRQRFGKLVISPIYESKSIGFEGNNFHNLVVGFEAHEAPEIIAEKLHDIEFKYGRERNGLSHSSRTLDLDLLLYGNLVIHEDNLQIPREDITQYAFVLKPLADIAGDLPHPLTGQSFSDLWEHFCKPEQVLWKVDIDPLQFKEDCE